MPAKKKSGTKKNEPKNITKDKQQQLPMADNAGKLVNSGRSQNPEDLKIKNIITGAEFEGPPY